MAIYMLVTSTGILKNVLVSLLKSKYLYLKVFYNDLDKFSKLDTKKENFKEIVNNAVSELCNELLNGYFDLYEEFSDDKNKHVLQMQT